MKLKTLLPSDEIHIYALLLLNILAVFQSYLFLLSLPFWILYGLKKTYRLGLFLFGIIVFGYLLFSYTVSFLPSDHQGTILEVDETDYGYRYVVRRYSIKYYLYTDLTYEIGDIITFTGEFSKLNSGEFEGDFNSYLFNRAKGIDYQIKAESIHKTGHRFTFTMLSDNLVDYADTLGNYTKYYVKSLVLGVYDFENKDILKILGITHLFVLSGLHVNILTGVLDKILDYLKIKRKLIIKYIALLFYLWVTYFPISFLRAALQYLGYETLNLKKMRYTRLDLFSFVFIGMILYEPFYIFHMGFILTFLLSFLFIISDFKSGFWNTFKITLYAQSITYPITATVARKIYPVSFITAPIFMWVTTYLLMPLAWISLIKPIGLKLDNLFQVSNDIMAYLSKDPLSIYFPFLTLFEVIIYYILWGFMYLEKDTILKSYKIILIIVYIVLLPFIASFGVSSMSFVSVGQGDTSVLLDKENKCTVVIDAYGDIDTFLYTLKVKTIDYLIITHGDMDHYKETDTLLANYEVKYLVLNQYDDSYFKISHENLSNILYVKGKDMLTCGNLNISILSPLKDLEESNSNSVVISFLFNHNKYLLMGDATVSTENSLIKTYGESLKSDVLKVGHHGSISSSSEPFLDIVNPKYAIISAKLVNNFNHPHPEVMERLRSRGIKILETSKQGTIYFKALFYRTKNDYFSYK